MADKWRTLFNTWPIRGQLPEQRVVKWRHIFFLDCPRACPLGCKVVTGLSAWIVRHLVRFRTRLYADQRSSQALPQEGPRQCRHRVRPCKLTGLRTAVDTVAGAIASRPCAYVHRTELLPHRNQVPPVDDRIDGPPAAGPPAYTYRTAPPAAGNDTGFATVRVDVRQVSTPVQQCAADGTTGEPGGTPRTP